MVVAKMILRILTIKSDKASTYLGLRTKVPKVSDLIKMIIDLFLCAYSDPGYVISALTILVSFI